MALRRLFPGPYAPPPIAMLLDTLAELGVITPEQARDANRLYGRKMVESLREDSALMHESHKRAKASFDALPWWRRVGRDRLRWCAEHRDFQPL